MELVSEDQDKISLTLCNGKSSCFTRAWLMIMTVIGGACLSFEALIKPDPSFNYFSISIDLV